MSLGILCGNYVTFEIRIVITYVAHLRIILTNKKCFPFKKKKQIKNVSK